jgi:hypothetical protein
MKLSLKGKIITLSLISFSFVPNFVSAKYQVELTPSFTVSEVYDDNIDLDYTDEKSDYITTASPSLNLSILSMKSNLQLRYSPTFVWYDDADQNDTTRHAGALTFGRDLTQHLRFDFTDTYLESEEPIEETEGVEGIRRNRNTYERNTGRASLRYLFGRGNECTLGYDHSWLENEAVDVDDGTIQDPFGTVAYWFDVRNGLELDYRYTKAIFSRDDDSVPGDDYSGHGAGMRYIYRFSPHTSGSLGYHLTNRNFEGMTEDYKVHDGIAGFEKTFSPHLSVSLAGGYYIQKTEYSDDQTGYSYDASLAKRFEHGNFTFGGSGGWDEGYLESERRGFSEYWGFETSLDYWIGELLSCHAGGSYRHNKDDRSEKWETLGGTCGIRWDFSQRFSLSLNYRFNEGDDADNDFNDYQANQVMLILTGSRLYRW